MLQTHTLSYFDADTELEAYVAYDDAQPTPQAAVLVAHAWGGRDDLACLRARQLAELGYVGFALDMYGKGMLGSGPEENAKLMTPFMQDRARLQQRMACALRAVRGLPNVDATRVAAIGFCFGGLCVLDLARTGADVCGVVSFHGLFSAPGNTAGTPIRAKVLALHGHDDPMATPADVLALQTELTAAGADWQTHVYGHTVHAFTNPRAHDPDFGTVYNAAAERRAWQSMTAFLAEVLA